MKKNIILITISLALALFLVTVTQAEGKEYRATMGSTKSVSSHYTYFASAVKVINDFAPDVKLTLVESGGSNDNLARIRDGAFHLGLISDSAYYPAYHGIGKWKQKPATNLRQLWYYVAAPLTIAVSEKSGIKSIYDLKGKKFCPGGRGTASERMIDNAFKALGIEANAYRGSIDDHMAAFKDRAIVGYQKPAASSSIPDATTMAVMPFMKIRILGFDQDDVKKIKNTYPYYSVVPVAAKTYDADWNKEDIRTLGVVIGCGGRSDIPEWAAYNMVKAIWENRKPQEIAFPAFKDAKPESVSSLIITPFHQGAVRYSREIGIKIPDKLIPPEMK